MAEHLFCKQAAVSSILTSGSLSKIWYTADSRDAKDSQDLKDSKKRKEIMAKKKKGPRHHVGLQCQKCKAFNYITEYNKVNEQLKEQRSGKKTFPLKKYCNRCRAHTEHKMVKKLK